MTTRQTTFIPYKPKTILNRVSAPTIGFGLVTVPIHTSECQHGCQFCYCREQKYSPYDDPNDFAYVIK